jgi:hypothetical protein
MKKRPNNRTKPKVRLAKVLALQEEEIARITAKPSLPPVGLEYELDDATLIDVTYRAWIDYKDHGRNDPTQVVAGTSSSLSFSVDFGGVIQGGVLHVVTVFRYRTADGETGSLSRDKDTWSILGENPAKTVVKSYLGEIELQVIAYLESEKTFCQFYKKDEKNEGLPRYSRTDDGGFGIMQLTNSPVPTPRQIWDWKQNIDGGKKHYAEAQRVVRQHYKNERQDHPEMRDLTVDEYKLAFYQHYNSGTFYFGWDKEKKDWIKNAPNNYGDLCFKFEKLVRNGNLPPGWND